MSARDRILGRLRAAAEADPHRASDAQAHLMAREPDAPRPTQSRSEGEERLLQFEAKLRAVDATTSRVSGWGDLPGALAAELRARNLPKAIRCGENPAFAGLDWQGVEVSRGPGRLEEPATLSRAFRGVAETGTLALLSGPENPVTLTFLGETHFVALEAGAIEQGYEELWAAFRASGLDPRTINLVTGPSRSADIGQTLQLGAHGPIALHVFLVEGDEEE